MTDAMPWLPSCSELLWNVAWKGTLLLAAAWAVDRLWLRRRLLGADMLWTATLLGLLALPVGAALLPRVTLPVWPAPAAVEVLSDESATFPMTLVAPSEDLRAGATHESVAGETSPTDAVVPPTKAAELSFAWPSPAATIAAVWLLGCAALLTRLAGGIASMAKLVRRATSIRNEACGETWLDALAARKRQLGVNRNVRLLTSEETAIPFTTGWLRPAIVVPADIAAAADDATIDATLLHELTHIARGDYPVHLAGKLVEACYWWNPLAWLATARLYATRESICDGYCCWQMGDCERYGDALLALAERLTRRPFGGVGLAMARGSRLGKRLENLSDSMAAAHSPRGSKRTAGVIAAAALSSLVGSAALGVQTTENVAIADITARLAAAEGAVKSLSGELNLIAKYNFVKPGEKLPPDMLIEDEAVSSNVVGDFTFDCRVDGSGVMEADLVRTSLKFDGTENVKREKTVSLYDGARGKMIHTLLADTGKELHTFVRPTTNLQHLHLDPLNLAMQHVGKAISGLLANGNAKVVQAEDVDGRPTIVVEVDPVAVREDYIYQQRFWIDVERRVAVKRESMVQCGEGKPWALHYRVHCQDYEEAAPGTWLPKTVRIWNYHVTAEGQDHLTTMNRVDVKRWEVNASRDPIRVDVADAAAERSPAGETKPPGSGGMAPNALARHQLKVIVVDEAGEPVPDAQVYQNHVLKLPNAPAGKKQTTIKNEHYRTDAAGETTLTWEGESVDLRIWASHPGRVPIHAMWARDWQSDGRDIPAEFRFVLKTGTTIGGIVRDEAGRPIVGAKVEVFSIRAELAEMAAAAPTRPGVRPVPVSWLAEGETAIVTDAEGRWQATNIPNDDDLSLAQVAPEMRLPANATAFPLRLRVSHDGFARYDGAQDQTLEDAPSLPELRSGEAVVVLRAEEGSGAGTTGTTGATNKAPTPADEAVDANEYPDPPKLAYLAWELPPSGKGPQLSRAWNARGEDADEPLSVGSFELKGKTYQPHAWNWDDDTLKLHAHPLVLWFEDGSPFEYRPTLVAVVDANGERHSRGNALSRRWEKRLVSVAAPEKPFAWPEHVDLEISYPIEATQTIAELTKFSDQPINVADGVDWKGSVEADGRFASTLIIWRKPQNKDRTSYHAALFDGEGARHSNDAGGVVRTFNDREERVEWYEGLRPEEVASVSIHRQRKATATISDVPIRLDLLPKE